MVVTWFLKESQWIFAVPANWITSNSNILSVVDFLNICNLIAIGLGLIIGLFTRAAAFSGVILLLLYYLNNAPVTGIEYSVPSEGNYLVVSKTLIEASTFCDCIVPGRFNSKFQYFDKSV